MKKSSIFHNVYFVKTLDPEIETYKTSFFVRINTKGLQPFFASENNSVSDLNIAGEIVKMQWMQIPVHYPKISLDSFTISPSSIQGIVSVSLVDHQEPLMNTELEHLFNFPPPKILLEAFTHFKACCTRTINKSMPDWGFGWQPLFTSLLIANNSSLIRFRDYIKNK